ncbi:MAG: DUF4062 domain-containing protein [Treponema sp.]|nr:DUF4062 domain-containing protein [Treponema sp.]
MTKKYMIFICSSRDDLKAERKELLRMVSELGAIPVTSDVFDPNNEDDRRIIRKSIEDCDYFIALSAHKGGEMAGNALALELEYSYAVKAGVPVLALIIDPKARWKDSKKEKDPGMKKNLEAYKKRLEAHTHETWLNQADLMQKALFLLSREMNLNPRQGWVSANLAVDPAVANELGRLIRENELFRSQVNMDGKEFIRKVRERMRQVLRVLAANRVSLSFYYVDGENWENTKTFRCLRLFRLITPELFVARTTMDISHFLGNILNPDLEKVVRKDFPTPSNTIKKVMTDFALLKLVRCSGSGENETWEMTEFGKETFAYYRIRQMNRALGNKKQPVITSP